jgi:hypothetical protein
MIWIREVKIMHWLFRDVLRRDMRLLMIEARIVLVPGGVESAMEIRRRRRRI